MSHQMTLEEFGISLKEDPAPAQKQIHRERYVSPCATCICNHCANNVECMDKTTGEAEFGCFTCDECRNYGGEWCYDDNWKPECRDYKITEAYANTRRRKFKVLKPERGV